MLKISLFFQKYRIRFLLVVIFQQTNKKRAPRGKKDYSFSIFEEEGENSNLWEERDVTRK